MEVLIHSWTIRTALRLTERLEHFTGSKLTLLLTGRFYTKDALPVCDNASAKRFVVRLIMRLDELSFEIRPERGLVPVFILETHNQTNYKTFAQFAKKDNGSLQYKNGHLRLRHLRAVLSSASIKLSSHMNGPFLSQEIRRKKPYRRLLKKKQP